jgi:penicillin V acylase-like amidase (Ntn superfamily)
MTLRSGLMRTLTLVLAGLFSAESAMSCTRVLWAAPDGQVLVGRTQDWTEKADSAFRVYPRGIARAGAVAENPHKWTSKYGSVVLSAYDIGTHEGVNEKGLSAHALYLAVEAAFGERDPDRPNVASTIFRTVQDLTGGRYYFESTYAPNVVWIDWSKLDFTEGRPEMELQVEKQIFTLTGDVTSQLQEAKPFVFGANEP